MSKRKIAIVVGVLFLLIGGTIWAAVRIFGGDPKVKELKQLAAAMAEDDGSLSPEERREKWREFGQAMRDATPEQREQFRQSPEVQARIEADLDRREKQYDDMVGKFVALSGEERTKFLDAQIDEELKRQADREKRRKEWEARRQQDGSGQSSGSAGQGDNSSDQKTSAQGDSSGRRDGGRRGFGGPGGPGNTERMSERMKKRLDRTTPEQRANRDVYRAAMAQQRAARGLPPRPDPGPFGFGGRGGRGPR